ncbi:glycerol-3-phosphate acyltransferase PlsY [Caminicella sporogenes DSM 14501]|uniref:Glycerol-3-phosphate acyltransferase n=1 Tax=Caminicella sporogenes DSM 14501 TaxID=1121266 RepID=A0A1M6LSL2_9FIRM|nr:glycerol-3-phosphate 1-O-acyltransferase PlsY [Caminicella sporogenes]RKD27935.1 acyl-phosphate glycerol 3-phosphate acyltransferase [Caminicella sporogenes]SHJ74145.1 glycerol-3-phosphate acyltransferase PlsY [Caminicella sporogenes DSM 14501]
MFKYVIPIILSYLIGSLPFSFIVGKYIGGIDIRKHGSGNTGATNVLRTAGKKAFIIAFLGDFLKGFIVAFSAKIILNLETAVICSVFVVLGHCYSMFLGFKGGKGVATAAGTIFALYPLIGLILLIIQILILMAFNIMSLASIIVSISFPIVSILFKTPKYYIYYSIFIGLFVIYKHKSNIKRLISGNESKISFK